MYNLKIQFFIFIYFIFFSLSAQNKWKASFGFNLYNSVIDIGEFTYYNESFAETFLMAPQLTLEYAILPRHTIRFSASYHTRFMRNEVNLQGNIWRIRSLNRLSYLYSLRNNQFLSLGYTEIYDRAQLNIYGPPFNYPRQKNYLGYRGLHLGYGKKFQNGWFEVSNLLAFEFEELTPMSPFGFWVFDFGYYFNVTETDKANKKTEGFKSFGFALAGSVSYFKKNELLPNNSTFYPLYGFELFKGIKAWKTTFFFRKQLGLHIRPLWTRDLVFQTNLSYFGVRKEFDIKRTNIYGQAAFMQGFSSIEDISQEIPQNRANTGFSMGLGWPITNRFALEFNADYYVKTNFASTSPGFAWDRIRLSAIYYLPISTK